MVTSETRLQLDPAGPALAHLLEDRPGDRRPAAAANRGGCGARRCRARRRSAARNPCAARRPRRSSCASRSRADRVERADEGAVGVRLARPDVALVDMRVACRRRHGRTMPPVEIDRVGQPVVVPGAAMPLDAAVRRSTMSASDEPVARRPRWRVPRRARRARARSRSTIVAARRDAATLRPRSVLPLHGALVPLAEQQIRDEAGGAEDRDAGQRQQHQRGEEPRDVQPVLRLEQAEGEAGILARRARRELGDDRGDQRQPAGDPQARRGNRAARSAA